MRLISTSFYKNAARTGSFGVMLLLLFGQLLAAGTFPMSGTAPSIGITTFNNAFSGTTALLTNVPSPASVANVGNTGEATGILATGWDFTVSASAGNVSITVSAAGANPGGAGDYCIRMSSVTAGDVVQTTSVNSDDGSAFSLQYAYIRLNITAGAPANMIITGYRSGVAVSGATATVTGIPNATWTQIDVSAISAFQDIDQFTFTQAGTTSAHITYEIVDQIDIAAAVPLPLTLTDFSGRLSGNSVLLDWMTASEQNTSYFEVQRATDDKTYTPIGQVAAAGNSTLPLNYQFTDLLPASPATTWFYRLRMADLDGESTFSPILAIGASAGDLPLAVYPNPFRQQLHIVVESPGPDKVNIIVSDPGGKILLTTTMPLQQGTNLLSVPSVQGWPDGLYLLSLSTSQNKRTFRIVKNK